MTTLVDNFVSPLLRPHESAQRAVAEVLGLNSPRNPLVAEFGWSTLVKVGRNDGVHTILYDTGLGKQALVQNSRLLNVDLKSVEAIVLSHGHPDHTASTQEALAGIDRDELPVIMHPWALLERKTVRADGTSSVYPRYLDEKPLHDAGARVEKTKGTTPLASESALVSGEIPRVTPFEKGLPPSTQFLRYDGEFRHEPLILDDQALIVNLKDKGLVILTGCGHSGIINTVNYAKRISGVDRVYAIIGGFHLDGSYFDPIIDLTVESLKEVSPRYVVPSHCTGLRASSKMLAAMPSSYIENSVGTTLRF